MFTQGLSHFIRTTNFDDLPPQLVASAKDAVLDFFGVAMSGSQEPSGKMVQELVKENRSVPEAAVIGGRFKASCALAALANGNSSHAQDFDDCLDFPAAGLAHPTTGVFPAVLALGEKFKLSGKDLLTAYCLGVEAYGMIGLMTSEKRVGHTGWESTGSLGIMGAAAAVSKLLNLNERQTVMALGIAATMSCGLHRSFGSMAGHIHGGNAARHGIEAGFLAQKGYTATLEGVIEGPNGYYNAFSGDPEPVTEAIQQKYLDMLGNPWNIIDPGLMIKAYPCAHISHFGTYGGLQLRKKYSIDWHQIEKIEFQVPQVMRRIAAAPEPRDGTQARFSLVYCMCRALIHGEMDFSFFTDEAVKDPDTRQLVGKVNWVFLEERSGPFENQEITLTMKDGTVFSYRVEHPKGEPQNPHTPEELAAKYRKCARFAGYNDETIERVKDMVLDLEHVSDISSLTGLLIE